MVRSTAREKKAQAAIMQFMVDEGYATFARLFSIYTFILTNDPDCIGYTTPDGIICLNENLSMEGFSFVCRHEILHQWLNHHENFIKHVGKKLGLDPNNMSLDEINKATQIIYGDPNRADNIAKDWDLSRYYTDADKRLAKHLECCGRICEGLVLELDKPEWLNLTAEEMYDKLVENPEENPMSPPPPDEKEGEKDNSGQSGNNGQSGQSGNDSNSNDSGDGDGDDGSQGGDGQSGNGSSSGGQSGDQEPDPRNPGKPNRGRGNNKQPDNSGGNGSQSGDNNNGETSSERASGETSGPGNPGGDGLDHGDTGRPVMIGDRGNSEIQEEEQRKREAQVQKDIEKGRLEDKSDEELKKEQEERVKKLDSEYGSETSKDSAEMDIASKKRAEKERKAAIQQRINGSYNMRDYAHFKKAIEKFCRNLKNEADQRNRSWSRLDRKNQNPQIMKQGKKNVASGNVPIINVYLDCSGSCTPYHNAIMGVAKMLEDLEKKDHLCVCNIYYFADTMSQNRSSVGWANGWGGADLAQHLLDTGATNLIVCTDGDTNGLPTAANPVRLDHAWFICVNGQRPRGMIKSVKTRQQPELFEIGEKDR